MTEPDFSHHPDPIVGGPGIDLGARFGELTPLYDKMAHQFQGMALPRMVTVAVGAAAVGLPRSDDAKSALTQVTGAPIRYTVDGTVPTATVGFRADPGVTLLITGVQDLIGFLAIQEGAVAASLTVQFFS